MRLKEHPSRASYLIELKLEGVKIPNSPAYGVATPLRCAHHHTPGGIAGSAPAPDLAAAVSPAAWQCRAHDRPSSRLGHVLHVVCRNPGTRAAAAPL